MKIYNENKEEVIFRDSKGNIIGKDSGGTRYINFIVQENDRSVPILYEKKDDCCGCGLCMAVCPNSYIRVTGKKYILQYGLENEHIKYVNNTGAITLLPDEEGFLYPVVNLEKCIKCYRCVDMCAFKKSKNSHRKNSGPDIN